MMKTWTSTHSFGYPVAPGSILKVTVPDACGVTVTDSQGNAYFDVRVGAEDEHRFVATDVKGGPVLVTVRGLGKEPGGRILVGEYTQARRRRKRSKRAAGVSKELMKALKTLLPESYKASLEEPWQDR